MAKDARSLPAEAQEHLRRKAVRAVKAGMSQVKAAEVFGVTRQAVGLWVKADRERGTKALAARRRGRPRVARLAGADASRIKRAIITKTPEQLSLPFYLWTREAVAQLVEQEAGMPISVWTAGRYLKAWGFTPQKPIRRAFEQDPAQVRQWLEQTYPSIRMAALREKAEIYWGDESGLRSDHAAGRSFGLRGQTPVIRAAGRRFGCNMISAISNRGRLLFRVFEQSFRVPVFIDFLNRLVRQVRRKVFLIVDGHPVHRSQRVKVWLKANEARLKLYFLPAYSPELNPDELLNQDVKSNALGRRPPATATDLMSNVRGFLRGKQRRRGQVVSYFHGRHVAYAAP